MIAGEEGDTQTWWSRPDCVVICRLLKDGRYVLYRVDDPRGQLVLSSDEFRKVAELFKNVSSGMESIKL